MTCPCLSNDKKMYISIQTALIAFVLFNPMMFQAVRGILGGWVASVDGLPKTMGLLLHTVLFGIILYVLMRPTTTPKNQRQSVPGLPLL
jgi:hypothetical protein